MTSEERLNYDLLKAAESGDLSKVKSSVEHGADLECRDADQFTPLFLSVQNGHLPISKYLIKKNANVNTANQYGLTCLHFCCLIKHMDHIKLLVQNKADVNAKDLEESTPAHKAVSLDGLRGNFLM